MSRQANDTSSSPDDKWQENITQPSRKAFRPGDRPITHKNAAEFVLDFIRLVLIDYDIIIQAPTTQELVIGRKGSQQRHNDDINVDLSDFDAHAHGISRIHAMIAVTKNRLTLQDLDSINGTLINGKRALPLRWYPLQDGDELSLGQLRVLVTFTD